MHVLQMVQFTLGMLFRHFQADLTGFLRGKMFYRKIQDGSL